MFERWMIGGAEVMGRFCGGASGTARSLLVSGLIDR